jgi:hypothetical protein
MTNTAQLVFRGDMRTSNLVIKLPRVEYTFRNSVKEEAQTITLSDYSLGIRCGQENRTIPYANITSVRLCKVSSSVYKMILHEEDHKPLIITNRYVVKNNHIEDQSRLYATFVRVLHFHLKDKSKAEYSSGCNMETVWRWGIAAVFFSFALSFAAEFLGFRIMDAYLEATILTSVFAIAIFLFHAGRLPRAYTSTEIPLDLLPEA